MSSSRRGRQSRMLKKPSYHHLAIEIFNRFLSARQTYAISKDEEVMEWAVAFERNKIRKLSAHDCSELIENVCGLARSSGLTRQWENIYPVSFYMLRIAYTADRNDLIVHFFNYHSPEFRNKLLNFIRDNCKNITTLVLSSSDWCWTDELRTYPLDTALLESVLQSMTSLRELTILYVCNDETLRCIAASYLPLKSLAISGSAQVTDKGIISLLNIDDQDVKDFKKSFDSLDHKYCFHWETRSITTSGSLFSPNLLREILERLDIRMTSVTSTGTALLLKYVPNLEVLYSATFAEALELLEQQWVNDERLDLAAPVYNLTFVEGLFQSEYQMTLLGYSCPYLTNLCVHLRHTLPSTLSNLTQLVSLNMCSHSPVMETIENFYSYIEEHGSTLQELFLHFASEFVHLNIYKIVRHCRNLVTLNVHFTDIQWEECNEESTSVSVSHLENLQLSEFVTSEAVTNILALCTKLVKFHLYSCSDAALLSSLNEIRLSSELSCFFILYGGLVGYHEDMRKFLRMNANIKTLGCVPMVHDDLDTRKKRIKNLGLELSSDLILVDELHWQTECIPNTIKEK